MKLSMAVLVLGSVQAFAPGLTGNTAMTPLKNMAENVGIPCEDECALESFPNLPASVHPGVVSGQAMMDLLDHAKENGKYFIDKCIWYAANDGKDKLGDTCYPYIVSVDFEFFLRLRLDEIHLTYSSFCPPP
jgi:hypothetical protein